METTLRIESSSTRNTNIESCSFGAKIQSYESAVGIANCSVCTCSEKFQQEFNAAVDNLLKLKSGCYFANDPGVTKFHYRLIDAIELIDSATRNACYTRIIG